MPRTTSNLRPYLKWAGGKRQLLPSIRARLPQGWADMRYFEPFVGAGAVLFDLSPARAVVNDANSQLILTYRAVRDDVEGVAALLERHAKHHSREYYYELRGADRTPGFARWGETRKAARLIYLNKTCFNGLYRVNSQGLFNVPFGSYRHPAICEEEVLRAVSRYLREHDVQLLSGDFAAAVEGAGAGCFVYFDPPYHSEGGTNFTGYQSGGFGEQEQIRLRDAFAALSARGARCMLSNSATGFIQDLDRDFHVELIPARRAINSDPAGRGNVNEVLVTNF